MAYVVPPFINYNNCASATSGGKILFATDDFFASADNLLKDQDPIENTEYTQFGKWMDGWETRRRRETGNDWCIIKLSGDTVIKGIHIDTGFFTGNYAPRISIQAELLTEQAGSRLATRKPFVIGVRATAKEYLKATTMHTVNWPIIINMTQLRPGGGPGRHHYFNLMDNEEAYTHLRLNLLPDGGIARFRVYGEIRLNTGRAILNGLRIDMLALKNGGRCLTYSNAHYGHPRNLIKPGRSLTMADGWETARRLDRPAFVHVDENGVSNIPGSEWAIFKLGICSVIVRIEVETFHFKGNAPNTIEIAGTEAAEKDINNHTRWITMLPMQKLKPNSFHKFKNEIIVDVPFNCVKITIAPDGGISRVRMIGFMYIDPLVEE